MRNHVLLTSVLNNIPQPYFHLCILTSTNSHELLTSVILYLILTCGSSSIFGSKDCFHGDILGHPLRLYFSSGCAALVGPVQILLKVLDSPKTNFLGTDNKVIFSHICPICKSRCLEDSIYKIFLTSLSFSLFPDQS